MSQAGSEREGGSGAAEDELRQVVEELRTELHSISEREGRRESRLAAFDQQVAHLTEHLGRLTQRIEQADERLAGVAEGQQATLDEHRRAVGEAAASLARTLGGQVQQVESQLVQLVARTARIDDIQQNLGRSRDAITALTTRADRADESNQRLADDQAVALARLAATTDALASTVGAVRAAIGTHIDQARDATVAGVDERVGVRLDGSTARVEETLTSHLASALGDLGITQLRQSVAEVLAQIVESRADARQINESIAAFDDRVAQSAAAAVLPVTTALGRVRQQIEAIPAPDLGAVAAQLARLSAMLVSQGRDDIASAADLDAIRTSMEEALAAFGSQLAAAADATADIAGGLAHELRTAISEQLTQQLTEADAARQAGIALLVQQLGEADAARQANAEELSRQLRQQLSRADEQRTAFTEQVTHQLSQADVALRAGVEVILAELTAVRDAAERRSGSRWRRGTTDDAPEAPPVATGPSEVEQRIERALQELDRRLASLGQLVERAGALADDAAQSALATYRLVNAPPPPPAAPPAAAKKAATKKKAATTKKAAASTRASAKRTAKKAAPDASGDAPPT